MKNKKRNNVIKVYALVGKSGTGKSYKVNFLAHKYDISLIIDDGLLISKNKILAGKSAKKEKNKLAAIKNVLFQDPAHRTVVQRVLKNNNEEKILILGTSIEMVEIIRKKLKLPKIIKIINIEDVSKPEEIKKARFIRKKYDKHVIPVPRIEIESNLTIPGNLIDTIKMMLTRKEEQVETVSTIMRPDFSYNGKLIISKNVLIQLVKFNAYSFNDIYSFSDIKIIEESKGITISFNVVFYYNKKSMYTRAEMFQKLVKKNIEKITGLNVLEINILLKSIKIY